MINLEVSLTEVYSKNRGVLPPGSEGLNLPSLGLLVLRLGELRDFQTAVSLDNIKIKPAFWGENTAPFLLRATNSCLSEQGTVHTEGEYLVKSAY